MHSSLCTALTCICVIGFSPNDLGLAGVTAWDAIVDKEAAVRLKGEWACDKMAQLLDATSLETGVPICPELAVKSLIEYCVKVTRPSREWLESTTVGQLPSDYAKYPGYDGVFVVCTCDNVVFRMLIGGLRAPAGSKITLRASQSGSRVARNKRKTRCCVTPGVVMWAGRGAHCVARPASVIRY